MTIAEELSIALNDLQSKHISTAQMDAEVLLGFVLNMPRELLSVNGKYELKPAEHKKYASLITRRTKCEPIDYIIGEKKFLGLRIRVNKNVFIPRSETELLVGEVIKLVSASLVNCSMPTILDIGTGSGCIALALKQNLPTARIIALDVSPRAIKLARLNAKTCGLNIELLTSDLLSNPFVNNLPVQIMVANLPYLAKTESINFRPEIKLGLKYEPQEALYAHKSGTYLYERLFKQIVKLDNRPQFVVMEIGHGHLNVFLGLIEKYFPGAKIELKMDSSYRPRFIIINL